MRKWTRMLLIGLCLVVPVIMLGCGSLDDDTGPTDPGGGTGNNPPGGGGQADFSITVTANPPVLEATGSDISKITARVRYADTGQRVPNGTSVAMHTTMGMLDPTGDEEGALTIGLVVLNGEVECFLTSGTVTGTAVVSARVGGSVGYVNVPFVTPDP